MKGGVQIATDASRQAGSQQRAKWGPPLEITRAVHVGVSCTLFGRILTPDWSEIFWLPAGKNEVLLSWFGHID